jgi:hypothetical protein
MDHFAPARLPERRGMGDVSAMPSGIPPRRADMINGFTLAGHCHGNG